MTNLFFYIGGILFIIDTIFISIRNRNKEFELPIVLHWSQLVYWAFLKFGTWLSVFELVWLLFGITTTYAFWFWAILLLNVIGTVASVKDAGKAFFIVNNSIKILIIVFMFYLKITHTLL